MPVPSLVTDLSTTVASNSPAGSENVFPNLDDYIRTLAAFLASIRDNSGNGWVSPYLTAANPSYTGTLTGGTGVVNLGSGQFYKSATGDVGIGTASPAAKLQVVGGQVLLDNGQFYGIKTSGGVNNSVLNLDASNNLLIGAGGATTTAQLWTGGAERARITSGGDLLVGTTATTGSLSNTTKLVPGVVSSYSGTVSATNATATTMFATPNPSNGATFLVTVTLAAPDIGSSYTVLGLLRCASTTTSYTNILTAASLTVAMIGTNLQVTQSSGLTQTVQWSLVRLV